jgi:hypothetical protein
VGKRLLVLIVELVALSVPLTWLWLAWGQDAYQAAFGDVAGPLLRALGVKEVVDSPAQKRFVNYVPFLALMLVTPGLALARRLGGILLGIPLIFLCHVGLVAVEVFSRTRHRPTEDPFSTVFPAAMFADAFPFILWALFANEFLRELLAKALGRSPSPP